MREYLTALVEEERVSWRELRNGAWREVTADSDGVLRSRVFPRLWLDELAMWRRDSARVLDVLQQGMATGEYAEFL